MFPQYVNYTPSRKGSFGITSVRYGAKYLRDRIAGVRDVRIAEEANGAPEAPQRTSSGTRRGTARTFVGSSRTSLRVAV